MRLAEPYWLVLLVLVPVPWLLSRGRPRVSWPSLDAFKTVGRRRASLMAALPYVLRGAALACCVVALARPQTVGGRTRIAGQGVAIVVALDQSSSMNAEDFPKVDGGTPISRLDAAKQTIARFLAGRPDDLLGLVVFANYPDFASHLTLDQEFLTDGLRSIRTARPGDDGTNLGDAIVWALEELNSAQTVKKVLLLVTDGRNSPAVSEPADPVASAGLARKLGVVVHTIAIGKGGTTVREVEPTTKLEVPVEVEGPDLKLLAEIAKAGGGKPFEATDGEALDRVFAAIDALEKSPVRGEVRTRYDERFSPWAATALGLILIDRVLAAGRLRRIP